MYALLAILIAAYLCVIAWMYVMQRRLIYHPDTQVGAPQDYDLALFDEHSAKAADGVMLQLWYRPALPGYPTIVYYHGNASNIGGRANIYTALTGRGFGLVALSYRGYGKSGGAPTEEGIYDDARAALAFATVTQGIPIHRIMLYGESLGSGVAVQMASEYNVGALIIQAGYTSVAQRAAEIYRYLPVRLMIKDRFDSLKKIDKVKAPLLLFHGERDEIIPVRQGKALFAAATARKQAFFFPHNQHNDFDSDVISAHVSDFAKEINLIG